MRNSIKIVAVMAALLGCSETSAPTTTVIRFQGTVTSSASQAPINNAEIILQWSAGAYGTGTHWAYTDANGAYTMEKDFGGDPFSCDFGMTAQAPGFRPKSVQPNQIECKADYQTFDFALDPA
jgi:hypothetical protein